MIHNKISYKFFTFLISLSLCSCLRSDFDRAGQKVREGKFYLAIEYYLSFAQKNPHHRKAIESLFLVGNIQKEILHEPQKAALTFQKIVSSFPLSPQTLKAQKTLADILNLTLQDYQRAVVEYEKFLQLSPKHKDAPEVLFQKAQCYGFLRKYAQANQEYKTLIETFPKYEKIQDVLLAYGNNAYIGGQYDVAIKNYAQLLNAHPSESLLAQAQFGIAASYEEIDEFNLAKKYYQDSKKNYPTPNVIDIRLVGLEKRRLKKEKLSPKI